MPKEIGPKGKKATEASPEEAALLRAAARKLSQAVDRSNALAAQEALSEGADPNERLYGASEMPLLMRAVMDQDLPMVRVLLAGGADPNAVEGKFLGSSDGPRSVLRLACEAASELAAQIVRELCEHGATPGCGDIKNHHTAPVVYAIMANRRSALRAMAMAGYDFRAPLASPAGRRELHSALEEAQRQEKFELMDILLGAEARLEGDEIAKAMAPEAPGGEPGSRRPRV